MNAKNRAGLRAGQKPVVAVLEHGLIRKDRVFFPLWMVLTGIVARALARTVWTGARIAVRYWPVTLTVLVAWGTWRRLGTTGALVALVALAVAVGAVLLAWREHRPESFTQRVALPARGWWRWQRVYRWRWREAMNGVGLLAVHDDAEYLPQVQRVHANRVADVMRLRLAAGQTPLQVQEAAEGMRHVFRAYRCTAREDGPGWVLVRFFHTDPLVSLVEPAPMPVLPGGGYPDGDARVPTGAEVLAVLHHLHLGTCEDGTPWFLDLVATHVLIAGSQGAGKGSVLWSIARLLAPLVRAGLVQIWAVDPKGGMELRIGRDLFHRYADDSPEAMVRLLEEAADGMDARTARLAGVVRAHTPTVDDPWVIVLVDELADLTAHAPDAALKKRTVSVMSRLLAKGRAPGYAVIASVIDPRKDIVSFRDLFPTRIAMRLAEPEQTDLVLGDGARDKGADCSAIPRALPGVAFVHADTTEDPYPTRVRFSYITDDEIRSLVAVYGRNAVRTLPTDSTASTERAAA